MSRKVRQLACIAVAGALLGVCAVPMQAAVPNAANTTGTTDAPGEPATKVPKPRTIQGVVRSRSGTPVQGAVVYLKNTQTLVVKSYLSDADGRFHFRQLSMDADYDLWAEFNGKASKTKGISHFENKPDLHYTLKVNAGK